MWIFTTVGFFSVTRNPRDNNQLQVRARVQEDLMKLKEKYLPSMGPIIVKDYADYRYRCYVSVEDFKSAMEKIIEDIDYYNFKDTVTQKQGRKRADLYSKVWGTLYHAESYLT